MEQQIRFCTTSDGVRIAYATVGQGHPLVYVNGWVSHLQWAWSEPKPRAFYEGLAKGRLLVRYDRRGTGLSDWDVQDLSLAARVLELETVVDSLSLGRFALMSLFGGGPAIAYAARHPERVSRLILYGSCHRSPQPPELMQPVLKLLRAKPEVGTGAISSLIAPTGDPSLMARLSEWQRVSASGETAARILEASMTLDVTPLLKDIRAPTLVLHRRGDAIVPFELAREMASLIPGARLEPLDGDIHVPAWGDAKAILNAVDAFLGADIGSCYPQGLTQREVEVLRLIAGGATNREIAAELVLSVRTVERHITNIYYKIGARGKADATAFALTHGLADGSLS